MTGALTPEESRPATRLRVVSGDQTFDLAAAERAVRDLLMALGRDPDCEPLTIADPEFNTGH
jgi:hypothetical protein